ncbi:hypothetical protein [Candidatus Palauibacter sp.]|uniref:hypothetical protein n=1 Tax=Candidatus Palauibacter sp. TaxID=3101350 RepID=UPI003B5968EA
MTVHLSGVVGIVVGALGVLFAQQTLEERVEALEVASEVQEANQLYATVAYSRLVTYLCGTETTTVDGQLDCVLAELRATMDAVLEDDSLTAAQRDYLLEFRDELVQMAERGM